MASITKATTNPKAGSNAANYLQGVRQFAPENQNCPDRTLAHLGRPDIALDQFGRLAPSRSVQQSGYCGGQLAPQYITLVSDMVTRPDYIQKQGAVNGTLMSSSYHPMNNGMGSDLLVQSGIKSGSRYSDITSPSMNKSNPISSTFRGSAPQECPAGGTFTTSRATSSTARFNSQVPVATKYSGMDDMVLNLGSGGYENYAKAYTSVFPSNRASLQIP